MKFTLEKALSEILNLPVEEIRRKGGAWMVDQNRQILIL